MGDELLLPGGSPSSARLGGRAAICLCSVTNAGHCVGFIIVRLGIKPEILRVQVLTLRRWRSPQCN